MKTFTDAIRNALAAEQAGSPKRGRVYAYRYEFGAWVEFQILPPPTVVNKSHFGTGIAIDGHQALISYGDAARQCHAYQYDPALGLWSWVEELTRPDGGFTQGYAGSVALVDGVALVGHPGDTGATGSTWYQGSVYVFLYDSASQSWNFDQELFGLGTAPPSSRFGFSIAFDGIRAAVTAPLADFGTHIGLLEVWSRNPATGVWTREDSLTVNGLNSNGALGYQLTDGIPVIALDGDRIAVSATWSDAAGISGVSGRVFLLERNPSTGQWAQSQVIDPVPSGTGLDLAFGAALALEGDTLLASFGSGDWRGIEAHRLNPGTGLFERTHTITSPQQAFQSQGGQRGGFGLSMALQGDLLLVGEPFRYGWNAIAAHGRIAFLDARCHRELGSPTCTQAATNSSGVPATLRAWGASDPSEQFVRLVASDLPPNQYGYFLVSPNPGLLIFPGGSQGYLCLGGPYGRWTQPFQNSGASGTMVLEIDPLALPAPLTAIQSGQTWHFQNWHRDWNPGPTSNFTTAVQILFQ